MMFMSINTRTKYHLNIVSLFFFISINARHFIIFSRFLVNVFVLESCSSRSPTKFLILRLHLYYYVYNVFETFLSFHEDKKKNDYFIKHILVKSIDRVHYFCNWHQPPNYLTWTSWETNTLCIWKIYATFDIVMWHSRGVFRTLSNICNGNFFE